ncbi:MAG: hypothetical protein R3Y11_01325 [Pseudomonadota bacterium]
MRNISVGCETVLRTYLSQYGTELPNATNNLENMNVEELLSEFFDKRFDTHEKRSNTGLNVLGRFIEAIRQCEERTDIEALCMFIEKELDYWVIGGCYKCIVYMPERSFHSEKLKGKIIIELARGSQSGVMFFEIQISKKSNFANIQEKELSRTGWQRSYRYYNISLAEEDAERFVQTLLFLDLFRQRFLMTTASGVLGSMSTQKLQSESGKVFSFRECVLKE